MPRSGHGGHGQRTVLRIRKAVRPHQAPKLTAVETNQTPLVGVGAERVGILVHLGKAQPLALLGEGKRDTGPLRMSAGMGEVISTLFRTHSSVDVHEHCRILLD